MGDFCNGIGRMFTPSKSDNQSGEQYNAAYNAANAPTPQAKANAETGAMQDVGSLESQAAQRRLARLSKYFTGPSGVLGGDTTGSSGVF